MTQNRVKHSALAHWFLPIALLSGCSLNELTTYQPTKTSLEIQAIQSTEYGAPYKVVFAASLSVLQDLGYIISTADLETGLITAASPKSQQTTLFRGKIMKNRRTTVFIEAMPSAKTKVRVNFVDEEENSSFIGMKGASVTPIEGQNLYQDTFERIQKAIFVRTNI